MKKLLKLTLLMSFALIIQNELWHNLEFNHPFFTIIKVALILSIFELVIKPVIKILLLPINLLTLGLFRIIINTVGFYLAVFLIADFRLTPIHTPAINFQGLAIPALDINHFWAFVVNSASQNFLLSVLKSIIKSPKIKK